MENLTHKKKKTEQEIIEYNKTYYEKNKIEISQKRKERYYRNSGFTEKEQKTAHRLKGYLNKLDIKYLPELLIVIQDRLES